jgi:Fur family ferric uptake transcriptional regulator
MSDVMQEEIFNKIRLAGFRLTRPRKAIVSVLVEAEDWVTPEEILLRGNVYCETLGLVTVYRTLSLLTKLNCVRRVHFERGCHGYVLRALHHGHHAVCRNCHQVIEFPGVEDFSSLFDHISHHTGFLVEDHMLELHGLCSNCRE